MTTRHRLAGLLIPSVLLAAVIGCSDDSDPAQCGRSEHGDITFATGVDQSEGKQLELLVKRWADENHRKVRLVSLPPAADEQRSQLVANAQASTPEYDVLGLDVVWTAEFASRGYIDQLDRWFAEKALRRDFLAKPLETARWDGKLWAIPLNTNVGLLYYRKDRVPSAPRAGDWEWRDIRDAASATRGGFAGQFGPYEGLTVNVLEAVWDEGGDVLVGKKAVDDKVAATEALDRLRDGVEAGWIPDEALEYDEQGTLAAFQAERLQLMRNWPNAYLTLTAPGSELQDVGVAPLPGAGAVGGLNLGIAACSQHKETARKFIQDFTGPKYQRALFVGGGYPPTRTDLYRPKHYSRTPGDDGPLLRRKQAVRKLAPTVKEALDSAKLRPKRAGYAEVSRIIQTNARAVLQEDRTPARAIEQLEEELESTRLD